MPLTFYYLLAVANLLAFVFYGWDKYLAKNNKRRISEKNLLLAALLGGSVGAVVAMLVFRHKISKTSFLLKYFCVIAIQIGLLWYCGYN